MTATRSFWCRSSAALTLIFHLLVVAVGPVLDAYAELVSHSVQSEVVHVESADDPACDPAPFHRFCIVQALSSMSRPAGSPAGPSALAFHHRPVVFLSPIVLSGAPAVSGLGARAPPTAVVSL